jgi:hypothetical protein
MLPLKQKKKKNLFEKKTTPPPPWQVGEKPLKRYQSTGSITVW